ncbi:MAG: hypothetical protein L0Y80_02075 [Ignavibacteriae bacterium]|nr:hypothetical protein [Ignavibacteriota bacterium]
MGYIFESEIERILHSVRARTIGESEAITLGEVLAANVHPGIKAYFRAEVRKLLKQEREKEVRSNKFPYALLEIARLQEQMDLLLQYYYEFDQKDFDTLLDEAVHFQFNYLCRPQFTLLNFLFDNKRKVPVAEIEQKLEYCVEYGYYREIIKRYIIDNGLAKISYEEFESMLDKIDREIINSHTSWELVRMLKALFAFVDTGLPETQKKEGEPTLPINAAVVFFEDKKQIEIKERLEKERDANNLNELTVQDLANFVERVRTSNEEAVAVQPEKPARKTPRTKRTPSSETSGDQSPTQPSKVPIPFRAQDPAEFFTPTPGAKSTIEGAETKGGKVPAQASHEEIAGEGIHGFFSRSQQKWFIKKIFNKDEVSFREAMDTLSMIATWDEASQYLDKLFLTTGVDPFSKEAIEFTDKLYAWFHPGEQKSA